MKGLLQKEFAVLATSFKRNILLITILYAAISVASRQPYMGYALMLVFAMAACSVVSFDENSHWDSYVRTLPVTPEQIIGCKYLFALGGLAVGTVFAVIISGLVNLVVSVWYYDPDAFQSPAEIVAAILVCGSITLLSVALVLPFSYRFNSVNARSLIFLIFALLCGLGGIISVVLPERIRSVLLSRLNAADETSALFLFAAFFVSMLVLYGVSCRICVDIYEKKEY